MGILRGGLLVVVSVLLFVVFLAGNVLWTLDKSLDYETIKPELVSAVKEAIGGEINVSEVVGDEFGLMEVYCLDNSEYVFSEGDYTFAIPCEVISEQGPDAVVDFIIEDFVKKIYNGGVEQAKFNFAKLKDSIHLYFYYAFMIAIALFVLVFFLAEAKSNAFIISGSLLSISALPFAKIDSFFSFVPFDFVEYFVVFFSKAYSVFLTSLIFGLIILGIVIIISFGLLD